MVELTEDYFVKVQAKISKNKLYNKYYFNMYMDDNINTDIERLTYKNKADRIAGCMTTWLWDVYEKNELMDLNAVIRCKNNRFCPNCKLLDISRFIERFNVVVSPYLAGGYKMYMLTLTVPNCCENELESTLRKMSERFGAFYRKFAEDSDKPYHDRMFTIAGGVRVLEITYNRKTKEYHPHYHIVCLCKDIDTDLLEKKYKSFYSHKRKEYDYVSHVDMQISQIWTMLWHNIRITDKNVERYNVDIRSKYVGDTDLLALNHNDFREMDNAGFYEVFKYTFKDADIANYSVFSCLEKALTYKRLRQGFGCLYNLICEDSEEDETEDILQLDYEESPLQYYHRTIADLDNKYKNYKKINRKNKYIYNTNIKE